MSMTLEVGKLYICEEYHLLFYPDQETATADAVPAVVGARHDADHAAAFLSKRFGKAVSYTEKNIPLLVLQNKEKYIEVLVEDKKGWIIYEDWLNIKEIV